MRSSLFILFIFILLISFSCKEATTSKKTAESSDIVYNLDKKVISIDSLEMYIEEQMSSMKIPGCSFALINDGELVYHNSFGMENKTTKSLVTDKTLFEGASTSKPLFAYMIMMLVDEGKLDLDKPLAEYLKPDYHGNYDFDPRYNEITSRMVLSHTTGFPNWRGNGDLTIRFDPGTDFSYSGEGYQFLVKTVESILDTDYIGIERYFQERVAKPYNMTHTKYVQDEYNREHKATPHKDGLTMEKNLWTAAEFNAASALHTEAKEFSNWIIALMDKKGISQNSFDQIFEDQITVTEAPSLLKEEGAVAWTLGFAKYDMRGHIVYGHEGNNDGFNALFLMDIEEKWAMIQFNNANEVYDFGYNIFGYLHSN